MSEHNVVVINQEPIVQVLEAAPFVVTAPGPQGPSGAGGLDLATHIASPTPHPAYDTDLQSLTVLFENGLA